jgi:geranylgeranyl reductase family protein
MDDVIVIGAGPVGNHLAVKLAELGYQITVLEQQVEVAQTVCCTGILGKDCLEAFPLPHEFIMREAFSASFYSPFGRTLRIEKETPQAYVIERQAFQRWLAEQAQQRGVRYFTGCPVRNIQIDKDYVKVELNIGSLESRTVVVASGLGSGLVRRLGLGDLTDFAIGAQAEVASQVNEVELYVGREIAPGFFAWLVPTSPSRALAGLFCRRQANLYLRNLLDRLYQQGKIASPEATPSYKRVPLEPLPHTYLPRLLVVGEAAGQVKPTTGGGIYYGLVCAEIAAGVLNQALSSGDFSARQFSRYQKEWKQRLGREIRIGRFARGLFERLGDRQIDHIFGLVQSDGIHQALLNSPDFSFDWHGEFILRALKYKALHSVLRLGKIPFPKG